MDPGIAGMGVIMKYLRCLSILLLTVLSSSAAVPDYKAFIGQGGIVVVSNPPNGSIIIDGSGISAGALPSYALTNNQSTAVNLRNNLTITGTLTATNTTRFMGALLVTNGVIELGHEGFPLMFGIPNGIQLGTNHYAWWQKGQFVFDTAGQRAFWSNSTTLEFSIGSIQSFAAGSKLVLNYPTATRALVIDANGMVTNATGTPDGTKFLRDDNTYAVPSGGAATVDPITNRFAAANTFTNLGAQRQQGSLLLPSISSSPVIYFSEGGVVDGTNTLLFDRSDPRTILASSGTTTGGYETRGTANTNRFAPAGMLQVGDTIRIYIDNGGQNLAFSSSGEDTFTPSVSNQVSLGTYNAPWRTGYVHVARAKEAVQVDGTAGLPSLIQMSATNQTQNATIQGAHRMSVNITNNIGLFHVSSASVIEINARQNGDITVTNRITGNVSIIVTNIGDGDDFSMEIIGEVAGGTSRTVTIVPNTGVLVVNMDDFSVSPATSYAFTLTNGNMAELHGRVRRKLGTNCMNIVTRQAKL